MFLIELDSSVFNDPTSHLFTKISKEHGKELAALFHKKYPDKDGGFNKENILKFLDAKPITPECLSCYMDFDHEYDNFLLSFGKLNQSIIRNESLSDLDFISQFVRHKGFASLYYYYDTIKDIYINNLLKAGFIIPFLTDIRNVFMCNVKFAKLNNLSVNNIAHFCRDNSISFTLYNKNTELSIDGFWSGITDEWLNEPSRTNWLASFSCWLSISRKIILIPPSNPTLGRNTKKMKKMELLDIKKVLIDSTSLFYYNNIFSELTVNYNRIFSDSNFIKAFYSPMLAYLKCDSISRLIRKIGLVEAVNKINEYLIRMEWADADLSGTNPPINNNVDNNREKVIDLTPLLNNFTNPAFDRVMSNCYGHADFTGFSGFSEFRDDMQSCGEWIDNNKNNVVESVRLFQRFLTICGIKTNINYPTIKFDIAPLHEIKVKDIDSVDGIPLKEVNLITKEIKDKPKIKQEVQQVIINKTENKELMISVKSLLFYFGIVTAVIYYLILIVSKVVVLAPTIKLTH